ncbi:hypothetical protein F4776DRAFT_675198 [Hypoxylon sp. NC0597]|nr:hypothetical protein F4776DRAFT_675198 [Hypoxylon sp. NC0597]
MEQTNQVQLSELSVPDISYIISHVFLPPNVPQRDDYAVVREEALLKTVIETLSEFKVYVKDEQVHMIDLAISSVQTLHQSPDTSSTPSEEQLLAAFELLSHEYGTIVFHVRAQNAGILFTRSGASIHVEMFELSPTNEAVISTEGRLRRLFPGFAVAVPLETFQSREFQTTVASTLTKMSYQEALDTKTQVKKAQQMHDENRDTTHPKIVTELFSAFLLSVGSHIEVPSIWKNTREEVFWKDSFMPWRRSPLWLLIRVALQLQFSRLEASSTCSDQTYKTYMLFFMTTILKRTQKEAQKQIMAPILLAMSSKVSCRYQKLAGNIRGIISEFVQSALSTTNQTLRNRWARIQRNHRISYDFECLRNLDFTQDTYICLPQLDEFICCMESRGKINRSSHFVATGPLKIHDAWEIPTFTLLLTDSYAAYNLEAFESWVGSHLGEWLARNEKHPDTASIIGDLIENYHRAAFSYYEGNPEDISIMILTILELWIASDKSVVSICKLLEDYMPGIPMDLLENLNLPSKLQMERLKAVEEYLKRRLSQARFPFYEVFHSFGNECSFSVRYFDQSAEHQDLHSTIIGQAMREREAKRAEFREKKDRYQNLLDRSSLTNHNTVRTVNPITGNYSDRCSHNCLKCRLRKEATDMDIQINEWPLPQRELEAKSVVFELQVPTFFGHWRDTMAYVRLNVFESKYEYEIRPRASYPLANSCLQDHFKAFSLKQRITMLSENKPHIGTHRSMADIVTKTEDDVCLQSGLRFRYYDSMKGCFVVLSDTTQIIPGLCTYSIPGQPAGETSPLQQFITRPMSEPSGPSPNTVLATQSDCPSNISLEEYKALGSLPLGYNIQWQNILVQLALPSVDFRKIETVLVIQQCIFQAGPRNDDSPLRDGHKVLSDTNFVQALLHSLEEACRRVEENWQSFQELGLFICIARRVLSLATTEDVRKRSLGFLAMARGVALRWIRVLEEQVQSAADDNIRIYLQSKRTKIALICADTFNVNDGHLRRLLSSPDYAFAIIRCAIVIQEGLNYIPKKTQDLTSIMHRRWERLAYRGFGILVKEVIHRNNPALNNAIKESWSAFHAVGEWRVMKPPYHHWVTGNSVPEGDNGSLKVHFSLLTGELLINGSPLSRLPGNYEQHSIYTTLFGKSILEVVPSSVPGMRFSCKKQFKGHHLDLGLDESDEDLFIRATNAGKTFELVPRRILENSFPAMFVDNFIHWYNNVDGYLEFCPQEEPWNHSEQNWRLIRLEDTDSNWQLVKGSSFFVNIGSRTATEVSKILSPLEEPTWIHITLHESFVDIELPRLKLGFYLRRGETSVSSRQFRGMSIDEDQSIGTLIGLRSKLVLKDDNGRRRRKVIIPSGDVMLERKSGHVEVHLRHCSTTRVYVYDIDDLLGRLTDNGNLQRMLLVSYLHALTSSPLPDPLTGKTGTEQALTILNSAAVRSFKWLAKEDLDILVKIASLTPGRVYYPVNERVMQTVNWSSKLSFLAQHGEFYQTVRSIFAQAKEVRFFYPEWYIEPPALHAVEQSLLRRDLVRSSTFRVSGFGAEEYTTKYDVTYEARDRSQNSDQVSRAYATSGLILRDRFSLQYEIKEDLGALIREFLFTAAGNYIYGYSEPVPTSRLEYDAGMFLCGSLFIAQYWIPLHLSLREGTARPNRFQMAIWLATLSYTGNIDVHILQVLASFYAAPIMSSIVPPRIHKFLPGYGFDIKHVDLTGTLDYECLGFKQSPEASLPRYRNETDRAFQARRSRLYQSNKDEVVAALDSAFRAQWPCEAPTYTDGMVLEDLCKYIDVDGALKSVTEIFKPRFHNYQLAKYLGQIRDAIPRNLTQVEVPQYALTAPPWEHARRSRFVRCDDIFSISAPRALPCAVGDAIFPSYSESILTPRLPSLLSRLDMQGQSGYEADYISSLRSSVESLQGWRKEHHLTSGIEEIEGLLVDNLKACQQAVDDTYAAILKVVETSLQARCVPNLQWPRLPPTFFLQRLSWRYWRVLPEGWKNCITHYGVAISRLQRAERLLGATHDPAALISELCNPGHTNWQPRDQPESLLLEIESNITIRPVQEQIATSMRNPATGSNAVMQLNMGEGKSSVIVPMVAAALADGSRLVRVIVGKPQSKQMHQMLVSKLGGMLDRRIYHMPFSRAVKVGPTEMQTMKTMLRSCQKTCGILLVQPEHILSFKLMGIECILTGNEQIGRTLVQTQEFLNKHTRDIVDESDENFSVKFELVYTMGTQRATEHSPDRWVCIQQVLDIIRQVVSEVYSELPSSIELHFQSPGCFPQTRILQEDAADRILSQIAHHICTTGLTGFPIIRQPEHIRQAVHRYIVEAGPQAADVGLVEDPGPNGLWAGVSQTVLLLRGLIAGGVLAFAFGNKRWRVDYGLDPNRNPTTKLAVPYRAKDSPSPRSEFSHPDVVIILTSLSYYYGGLNDKDMFEAFNHLLKSDQAELEYQVWVAGVEDLPHAFRQLVGINLEDEQCTQRVFRCLRYAKAVVDYFLAHIVFPKEMKEFPHKLSASGWDIGEVKTHPTTGFSGTNDSRKVLPLDVEQLDLESQKHTNALVLENLLQPENSVALMPPRRDVDGSIAEMLLDVITEMDPPTRVILDVGAQILELDNLGVATTWLNKTSDNKQIQAAIFFDDHDELCVLDRKGHIETLHTSPFASQLDVCLVFLDEAHTRGTDLKLPRDYRAAVTLGANLTKDRLVQACMRMRMLGQGQSVSFCVSEEIQRKIRARGSEAGLPTDQGISVLDILAWAIGETWRDIHRSMPLWANQGRRSEKHQQIWAEAKSGEGVKFTWAMAERYLEDEARTLMHRYQPHVDEDTIMSGQPVYDDATDPISLRCSEFKNLKLDSAALQEEEERELSPEIEQEKEDQRPPQAQPATHKIHKDIKKFVLSGSVLETSRGYRPAFEALCKTTAASLFDVFQFRPGLLVSTDFARTIESRESSDMLDSYQRTVQWILTSGTLGDEDSTYTTIEHMMVISPYEAHELLPTITESKVVALHIYAPLIYAPQSGSGYQRMDTLDLYTVPERLKMRRIPQRLITELNLFAGQLYFDSFNQYIDACKFLGISWDTPGEGEVIAADGFILRDSAGRVGGESGLQSSSVAFFKMLHTKIRRNCESIDKTHMGKLLENQLLRPSDFEN